MHHLEQMEWGLPASQFIHADALPPAVRRRIRFRPDSPWHANLAAGDRLTWRGRNFIDAFVDMNKCILVHATMLELPAGTYRRAVENWKPNLPGVEIYLLICRASADGSIRVANDTASPRTGDLWRIDDRLFPAVIGGGSEGGMHVVLVLAKQNAPLELPQYPAQNFFSGCRISPRPERSRLVG